MPMTRVERAIKTTVLATGTIITGTAKTLTLPKALTAGQTDNLKVITPLPATAGNGFQNLTSTIGSPSRPPSGPPPPSSVQHSLRNEDPLMSTAIKFASTPIRAKRGSPVWRVLVPVHGRWPVCSAVPCPS